MLHTLSYVITRSLWRCIENVIITICLFCSISSLLVAGRGVSPNSCDQPKKRYSTAEVLGPSLCETSFLRVNRTWEWGQEQADLQFDWSGVSLMSDKSLQSAPTLCDAMDCSPPGSLCPWDSPVEDTGVGCHALLQESSWLRDQTYLSRISCIGRRVPYQ